MPRRRSRPISAITPGKWCVRASIGKWHLTKNGRRPGKWATNIETKCGAVILIVLDENIERREPSCEKCTAMVSGAHGDGDGPRIVVYGSKGYYGTGRVDHHGGAHNEGGFFRKKGNAMRHARELSKEYNLPIADETE